MYVTIAAERYGNSPEYQGAELKVPATRDAIQDAMERARVQPDGEYRMITFRDWPVFLKERLARTEARVQEVSFLASLVGQMDRKSLSEYEGVLACIETERRGHGCSIKDLINATANLENFDFLPGIVKDTDLGENALDGDYVRILQDLPDEVIDLLDPAKVGAYLRHSEKGAFTGEGYCFRSREGWQELYDGQELPETELGTKTFLSVRIEERDHPENGDVWLFLPKNTGKMTYVWDFIPSPYLSSCRITEVSSMIPAFEEHIGPDEDIGVLNELAGKLEKMTPVERLKYKAVLEFDGWKSVERSLWLTDHLDEYVFDPSQVGYADYGRECLENLGVDCSDPAFERFDFYQYGMAQYETAGMKLTSYGAVSMEQGPDLSENEVQEDNLQMGGCVCQTI